MQSARPAGAFRAWLESMEAVLRGERVADVPCDGCVGCCVSSYPIPLRPADQVALAQVPDRFLQLPVQGGLARMRFREDGSCPMLVTERCTIYADRPQTCREYDCRIYAAADLTPDGQRPVIQQRVQEWCFTYEGDESRARAAAVKRAAAFIRAQAGHFPPAMRTHSATAVAVLAVKAYSLFMDDLAGVPEDQRVRQVIEAVRIFDST